MSTVSDEVARLRSLADALENGTASTSIESDQSATATTTSGIELEHRFTAADLLSVVNTGQRGYEAVLIQLVKAVAELQSLS